MAKLRKYLVFWIIILGAFAPFSATLGRWIRSAVPTKPAAAAVAEDAQQQSAIGAGNTSEEVAGPDEELALAIEHDFEMVDVVNITHVGDGSDGVVFVIQMGIDRPVEDAVYQAILIKALQGLDDLKEGDENSYWVELMYGNWLVGRLQCTARAYSGADISSDNCEYNDVNPAAYVGDMVRWPGRPVDNAQTN